MKIALVGNQNSGKTTLFNVLTGMNAKIGNWPGVTIEKKTGIIKNTKYELTDLPGIYSLGPYSIEEEISRKFIFDENVDVIINIVDSTSLERSLYLTTQLLELDCKVIVALNMVDILEEKGLIINENILEKVLGVKVIKISALKGFGIKELITEIENSVQTKTPYIYDSKIEQTIKDIESNLSNNIKHKRFVTVKLLENDKRFENLNSYKIKNKAQELSVNYDTDLEEAIAIQRYEFIEQIKKQSVIQIHHSNASISDKLDKIFLNKFISIPIFILIMFLVYYLSVGLVGSYTVKWIDSIIEKIREAVGAILQNIGTSGWLESLVVNGIITGVGAVLSFVPQLVILFTCISILEATGYMSRIAILLDKIFKKIGLSGKSLIPFIIGSGCSVPGIMGTRIIENQDEREMTTILTPFIPCSAKLPIIALFSGYFFDENAGLISASLYFLAIVIIIINAILTLLLVFLTFKIKKIKDFGLRTFPNPKDYLYFIPLLLMISVNLWNGININNKTIEIIYHIISMLFIGFIEEIIFRGYLFKMMEKDNLKSAIIVSSITFGVGHVINLLNGADIIPTLLQIMYAITGGYLFVIIFYKSKSLWPCIITHSLINALSIFNIENNMQYISAIFLTVVALLYAYYINKKIKS